MELPLNGRDYNQLALLSPGVLPPRRGCSRSVSGRVQRQRQPRVSERVPVGRRRQYLLLEQLSRRNMQVVQPSVEALQEFKIQTNAYSAEFGRSSGALINAVIRSGTNAVHGSAYEFHPQRQARRQQLLREQDRASQSRSACAISSAGRWAARSSRTARSSSATTKACATAPESSGSAPCRSRSGARACSRVPIWNPFNPTDTGQDFRMPATADCNDGSGNCWKIPANLIDPVGQKVIDVSPDPNTGSPGQFDNNYVSVPIDRNRTDQFDTRVDHTFSPRSMLFGRYSFSDTNFFRPAPRPGLSEGSFNDTFGTADLRSQAVAAGRVLGPLALAWFPRRGSAMRAGTTIQLPPNFGSGCPEQLIGLQGRAHRREHLRRHSRCSTSRRQSSGGSGAPLRCRSSKRRAAITCAESVSWNRGAHALKFGGEAAACRRPAFATSARCSGNFNFSGRFTGRTTA